MQLAELIVGDLNQAKLSVMYGVQGGACARVIDTFISSGGNYKAVLNEQSAGYMAQGYYLASRTPAVVVGTTGPGATNLVSGVASCYYDRIPVLCILGQVKVSLQLSRATGTRMVGFQEVQHLRIFEHVSDICLSIRSVEDYVAVRNYIFDALQFERKAVVLEIPDDVQRLEVLDSTHFKRKTLKEPLRNQASSANISVSGDALVLGAGCRDLSGAAAIALEKVDCPVLLTWGAQHLASIFRHHDKCFLFGTHTPGPGNQILQLCHSPIVIGCAMLQHQIGRHSERFAPNASRITYINNDLNEVARFSTQFSGRCVPIIGDASSYIECLNNQHIDRNAAMRIKRSVNFVTNSTVSALTSTLRAFSSIGKYVFTDAGATLSWTYQAANQVLSSIPLKIYSSFNLHPMGFSNCAAVGCGDALSGREKVLAIIGDGSVPMNCQELAWLKSSNVKLVVIDNAGYGIIRMTQDDYYQGRHYGSKFGQANDLPEFSVRRIIEGFGLSVTEIDSGSAGYKEMGDFMQSSFDAIVIQCPFSDRVEVDYYEKF